jgi:hypothetical protein
MDVHLRGDESAASFLAGDVAGALKSRGADVTLVDGTALA